MQKSSFMITRQSRMHRIATFVIAALAVALIAAGCGSSDGELVTSATNTAGGATDSVQTNDAEAEPVATTAPVTSPVDSGGNDESVTTDPPAEPTAAPEPAAADATTDTQSSGNQSIDLTSLPRNFGASDTVCQSVVFASGSSSADELLAASSCLLSEIDASRPIVADFALMTTEGDPLYYRYAYDGDRILYINDTRRDAFGAGVITAEFCDKIDPGRIVPIVSGCTPTTSDGIAEAD